MQTGFPEDAMNRIKNQEPSYTAYNPLVVALSSALSLVIVGLLDTFRVPWGEIGSLGNTVLWFFHALAYLVTELVVQFCYLIAAQLLIGLLGLVRGYLANRFSLLGLLSFVFAFMVLFLYGILITYSQFRGYLPFIAAHLALWAFLTFGTAHWLLRLSERPRRLLGFCVSLAALALAIGAVYLNRTVYPGAYPTLHLTLLGVSFTLFQVALINIFGLLRRPGHRALLVSCTVGCGVIWGALVFLRLYAEMPPVLLSYVDTYSILRQSNPIISTGDGSGASNIYETPCSFPPSGLPEEEALHIFERYASMPGLPPAFRLDDYDVLLIMVDALRFDQTSFNGKGIETTPNLKRLEARGAFVYTRAYSPTPATNQTAAAMMTMTFASHAGISLSCQQHWKGALPIGTETVAEIFSKAGYRTFTVLHQPASLACLGTERGVRNRKAVPVENHDPSIDKKIAEQAIAAIDRVTKQQRRFFGWVFFYSPHAPYLQRGSRSTEPLDRYREEIRYSDLQIGRIIEHLKRIDRLQNTIVIVTADHAEEFWEHGSKAHALTVFSESIHVPLIIWIPGIQGSVVRKPTSNLYPFPWLMAHGSDVLRRSAVARVREDIAPMMQKTRGATIVELVSKQRMLAALVYDRYKINYDLRTKMISIFDLENDPFEQKSLSGEDYQKLEERYVPYLDAYLRQRGCKKKYDFRFRPVESREENREESL